MSKIKFFNDKEGGKLAVKKFKTTLLAAVIKKTTLTLIFIDGKKKSIKLSEKQVKSLSHNGKIYEYSEDELAITGVKPIKII